MIDKEYFFIHISKNAGTSVEEFFKGEGNFIGRYDPFYLQHNLHWHTSPSALHPHQKDLFQQEISAKTTFIIHRSPFDRVLSEMNCKWGNPNKFVIQNSRKKFNKNLLQLLICVLSRRFHNKLYTLLIKFNAIGRAIGDHWIPQSHYLKYFSSRSHPIKVIPFELLNQGVCELTGKQTVLPHVNEQHSSFKHDLSAISTLNKVLIRIVYADDLINHKRLLALEKACACSTLIKWRCYSLNTRWCR